MRPQNSVATQRTVRATPMSAPKYRPPATPSTPLQHTAAVSTLPPAATSSSATSQTGWSWLPQLSPLSQSVAIGVADQALQRFIRSKWLPISLGLLAVLFLVCLRYPFGSAYFYEVSSFGLGALAVVLSYVLVHQIAPPMSYLRLGLRSSIRSVFAGLLLASGCISALLLLLLLLLALLTQRFADTSSGPLIAGAIGLLANCLLLGMLTLILSTPAATQRLRFAFLIWLVLALASYSATGFLAALLSPARWLLLPFAACYDIGNTGVISWGGLLALLMEALYIIGLIWFAELSLHFRLRKQSIPNALLA